MKKLKLLVVLLLFLQASSSQTLCSETIQRSFWQRLTYACRSIGHTTKATLTRIKNIQLTKTTIAKAAFLTTVATGTLYGLSRLKNYFWNSRAIVPPAPVNNGIEPIPAGPVAPAGPQPEHPAAAQPAEPAPGNAPGAAPLAGVPPVAQPIAPAAPQPEQPAAAPAAAPVPGDAPAAPIAGIPPVAQPAAQAAPVAEPAPAFVEATDENLAFVPYFADPAQHVIEPIHIVNTDNGHADAITIQQLRVLDQFAIDAQTGQQIGGGGASCGYHAGPKNVPAIAGLIQGLDTAPLLTRSQAALALFNPQQGHTGRLRKLVSNHRIKTALKQYYAAQLRAIEPEPLYGDENTAVLQTIYQNLINELIQNVTSEALDMRADIELTPDNIIDAIQALPIYMNQETRERLRGSQEDIEEFMRDRDTIARYIQIRGPLRISQADIPLAWHQYNRQAVAPFAQNGEMLNEEEIHQLLDLQQREPTAIGQALNPRNIAVTVVEDTTPQLLEITENVALLRHQIQAGQLPEQRIHAFVLGSANQRAQSGGHWITVVVELARNRRRYTITDSANNHIRMFAGQALNLIRFLEGNNTAHLAIPPEAFKQRLLAQLRQNIEACEQHRDNRELKNHLYDSVLKFQEYVRDYRSFGGQNRFHQIIRHALSQPAAPAAPVRRAATPPGITGPVLHLTTR